MAWTTSVVVTACISAGLWRHRTIPASEELSATSAGYKWEDESVLAGRDHLEAGVEPQIEVEPTREEVQLIAEQSSARLDSENLILNASTSAKLSNQEGETAISSPPPIDREARMRIFVICLAIFEILCFCACCHRFFSREEEAQDSDCEAAQDEGAQDDDEQAEETADDGEELEVVAEVQPEGELNETHAIAKKGLQDHENPILDLPTPARAAMTDRRDGHKTTHSVCSSVASGGEAEAEDDIARAERYLQEKSWVLDDPSNIIFEEEKDEFKFHRKRSKILGCFARAFRDQLSIREAGEALLDDVERLEEENRQAVGDVAYWRTLAEDLASKQSSTDVASTQSSQEHPSL